MSIAIEPARPQPSRMWLAHGLNASACFDHEMRPIISGLWYEVSETDPSTHTWEVTDGPFLDEDREHPVSTAVIFALAKEEDDAS